MTWKQFKRRNLKIRSMRAAGETLQIIADKFEVSPERVRQILHVAEPSFNAVIIGERLSNQVRLVTQLRNQPRTEEIVERIAVQERVIDSLRADMRISAQTRREKHTRLLALVNKADAADKDTHHHD